MPKYAVVLTPVEKFGGRSNVRFGVGEKIELVATEQPATKTPTAVDWMVKSGPAKVAAGKTAGSAVVTCGNQAGTVVLELRDKKTKAVYANKRLEVVAPTGVTFEHKVKTVKYGLGFKAAPLIEPFDVSFKAVETREGAAPYEGTGCFAQAEASLNELAEDYAIIHPVMGEWTDNLGGAKKNRENAVDTVTTAIKNYGDGGVFVWRIPWFYRVKGQPGDFRFTTAVHEAKITKTGAMQLSKLNVKIQGQL